MADLDEDRRGSKIALVTRYYTRASIILLAAAVACTQAPAIGRRFGRPFDGAWTLVVAAVVVLAGLLLIVRWERRLVARAKAADYKLCLRCGYSLAGHDGRVSCPECGTETDLESAQVGWRAFRPRLSGFLPPPR